MGAIRVTAAALLILIGTAAAAECVTGVRLISSRASSPNLVAGPAAWNGVVLAVAKTQENSDNLWIGFYDGNFDPLFADRFVTGGVRSIEALLPHGSDYALFYRTNDGRLLMQRVAADGFIGGPVAITPSRKVSIGDEIEIVFSDALQAYVVARYVTQGPDRGVWVTVIEPEGAQRFERKLPPIPAPDAHLAVDVTDTGIIGVFYMNDDDNKLVMVRVVQDQFPETGPIATAGIDTLVRAVGDRFVVIRSTLDRQSLRWFIADTSGEIVKADAVLLTAIPGQDVVAFSLIEGENELALSYVTDQIFRLRRFTIGGTLISDTRFSAAVLTPGRAVSPYPIVWTGMSYVSPAVRSASDRLDSYLLRYCPLRAALAPQQRFLRAGEGITFTASATGGVPGYEFTWFLDGHEVEQGPIFTRTFSRPGPREIRVVVTDDTGATTSATWTLEVVELKRRVVRH